MSTKYEHQNGAILRDGVKIATRDPNTGTIDYLPDMDRYRAPVSAWLKEAGLDRPPVTPPEVAARQAVPRKAGEDINVTGDAPAVEAAPPPPIAPTPAPPATNTPEQARIAELEAELAKMRSAQVQPAPPTIGSHTVAHQPTIGYPAHWVKPSLMDAPQDPVKMRQYSGAPAFDPQLGDKTPAFVRWLCKHFPNDARERYAGRRVMGNTDIEQIIRDQR